MIKVVVVGVDGLEPDLVEEWNLKGLKQEEHGKVNVPINKVEGKALSPEVWGDFLTGKHKDRGFKDTSTLIRLLKSVRKYLPVFKLDDWLEERSLLSKYTNSAINFPELGENEKTFIDETGGDYHNSPFYDYDNEEINREERKYIKGEISIQELKNFLNNLYEKNKEKAREKLEKTEADLFFTYFHYTDAIQHHFYMDEDFIKEKYEDVQQLILDLKNMADDDALFIIVSDHGLKKGKHTEKGFYSFNRKIGLDEPHITDFYDIILEELNLPTSKDKDQIKKNLKDLGYI